MSVPTFILLKGALRDRISIFYATLFPIGLLVGLGIAFPSQDYRARLLAGVLAMGALFFSSSGVAFEALAQRVSGVYKLLRATPYRTVAFITNLTVARGVVALLSCGIVALCGVLIFRITLSWQGALLLLPVLALGILCFTFLGLMVGNLAQNEGQAALLNNLITLPMIFASEAFYSLSGAPDWLKAVGQVLPFNHFVVAVRGALAGDAASIVAPCAILLGYTILTLLLAAITFRWDPDGGARRGAPQAA